jgi:hypothetical protein
VRKLAAIAEHVASWHETIMPAPSPQVRYEEMNGPGSVAVPGPSLTHNESRRFVACHRPGA